MKCINLSALCGRGRCDCERERHIMVEVLENLVRRSRAYHAGLQNEMYNDGISMNEIPIEPDRVISLEECDRYESWIETELDPMKMELEYEIKKELEEKRRKELKKKLLKDNSLMKVGWITLTCPKEYDPEKMLKITNQIMKRKPFKHSMATIELIGSDGQYHPHLHMLVQQTEKPAVYKAAIKGISKVKVENKHFYVHVPLTDLSKIKEKEQYLRGIKQEKKLAAVEEDKKLRAKHNIPDFFSQGDIYN